VLENSAAADLAVGKSAVRRRILALLMAEPDRRLHLREIQRQALTSPGTASRELGRLVAAGLVAREAEGNQVYFRSTSSPFATMLRTMLVLPPAAQMELPLEPETATSALAPIPDRVSPAAPAADKPARGRLEPTSLPVSVTLSPAPKPRLLRSVTATPKPTGLPRSGPAESSGASEPAGDAAARPDPIGMETAGRMAELLGPIYERRLKGVYLYGSRARGQARPDSDVDVLIVLDRIDRYGDELELTSPTCASLSLELGLIVSRVLISENTWSSATSGQLATVRAEAVPV
jgi:predicted nucleotidyltransferase/DNA-binding transcriptional ArsR family regulator